MCHSVSMSDKPGDSLLHRVQSGLEWPQWSSWGDTSPPQVDIGASVDVGPVDDESRGAAMRRRIELAKSIADGGPYLEVFSAQARARVEQEAGTELGPLASFTFAIKDLVAVAGRTVSAGSAVRADAPVETTSAPIVTMLESLGAVAMGVVTLHEFAFGVTGVNHFAGTARNPKAPDRVPGGSSSGSAAAVADGSARIAIGTDTGGSVRIPASFCGVVGYKPSHGLYPAAGVFPLSSTLDHVGLFAVNSADIITAHRALGYPATDPQLPARVGVARADVDAADADVQALVEAACESLAAAGCEIIDVGWPDAEKTFVTSTTIMFSEAAAFHAAALAAHGDRYGDDIKTRLAIGAQLSGPDVATAHEYRRQLIAEVSATLADVDVIIGPTTPMTAPLLTQADDPALAPRVVANTRLANVVGLPAVSIPMPSEEAPVGLQILGLTDAALLGYVSEIETVLARS